MGQNWIGGTLTNFKIFFLFLAINVAHNMTTNTYRSFHVISMTYY
jgi:hypothetical protein